MTEQNEIQNDIRKVKALTEDMLEYQSIDVRQAYGRVNGRIRKNPGSYFLMPMISRIAVVLLLPLLISSLVFSYLYVEQRKSLTQVALNQVQSAPGTVTRLVLSDQSVVWLNSGSTLSYPSVFTGKEREVKLVGEGFFEVESDHEHPFYVTTTDGIKVMAYGTRFNVNAYDKEPMVEAVLEKGHIDVIRVDKRVRLEPGKQVAFDRASGTFTLSDINLDEKIGWKDGRLVFRNTPLDVVLERLSKRYNVDIVLHKKGNGAYNYRATFTTETIGQILDYLKLTAPIEWSVQKLKQQDDTSFARERIDVYLR